MQISSISGIAAKAELGRESMYKMLSSKGNPKLSTLAALFRGLGLKIVVQPDSFENNHNKVRGARSKPSKPDHRQRFA